MGIQKFFKINIVLLLFLSIFVLWKNPAGDDIALARSFYLSTVPHDYLGAFSTVFYGLFPSIFGSWWHSLLLFQLIIAFVGLILIYNFLEQISSKFTLAYIVFSYFVLLMAGASSRDGTMISLLFFGIGLLSHSFNSSNVGIGQFLKVSAFSILIISFSFRPWLSIVMVPILFWTFIISGKIVTKKSGLLIWFLAIFLILAPVSIDQVVKKIFNLNDGYPEQMVMIHDLSTTYCWRSNPKAVELAYQGLAQISTSNNAVKNLCQFYRPNTWQAVVFPNTNDLSTKGLDTPLKIIAVNEEAKYNVVRASWLSSIKYDPFGYIQNHLMFATQVLISGEMRDFSFLKPIESSVKITYLDTAWSISRELFIFPFDLFRSFHIFSPLVTLAMFFMCVRKINDKNEKRVVQIYFASFLAWITMTCIGYASDNGRYTYGAVLLLYLSVFLSKSLNFVNFKEDKIK
jgi:hypothetical protein